MTARGMENDYGTWVPGKKTILCIFLLMTHSDTVSSTQDQILICSACAYDYDDAWFVVHSALRAYKGEWRDCKVKNVCLEVLPIK